MQQPKKVIVTKNGNQHVFDSVTECSEKLGIHKAKISNACKTGKPIKNLLFCYAPTVTPKSRQNHDTDEIFQSTPPFEGDYRGHNSFVEYHVYGCNIDRDGKKKSLDITKLKSFKSKKELTSLSNATSEAFNHLDSYDVVFISLDGNLKTCRQNVKYQWSNKGESVHDYYYNAEETSRLKLTYFEPGVKANYYTKQITRNYPPSSERNILAEIIHGGEIYRLKGKKCVARILEVEPNLGLERAEELSKMSPAMAEKEQIKLGRIYDFNR